MFITSPLGVVVCLLSIKGGLLTNFQMCVLLITRLLRGVGRLGTCNPVNHIGLVTVVTPSDRHESVRNRSVIKLFGDVFVLSCCHLTFLLVGGGLS